METLLYQATIYLVATVIAVPIAARLGLGSVLGYLLAGLAIGPLTGIVGSETEELRHVAEFGVVMMLFLIGLELEPRALWDMRHRLLGLGGLQILVTLALVAAVAKMLGLGTGEAVAVGMIFSVSSTAIVLQTLTEKKLMHTPGGRSAFSVLLTQDIAVIPMLVVLPLLSIGHGPMPTAAPDGSLTLPGAHGEDHSALSLVAGLPGWGAALVTLGAVALVIILGAYGTRPAFRFIAAARLRELNTAFALLIVVAIAFLMGLVGLSAALGTFLAGVVLANSEFRHELESDLEPFKGLLLGLFFITVGAAINVGAVLERPFFYLGLTLALVIVKGVVLYALALAFRLRGRDRWLFTLGLAQAGEFGFVLVSFSVQQAVLPGPIGETVMLVIALSMLITPLLFILLDRLSRRLTEGHDRMAEDDIDEQGPVIIAGIGRFGQVVNRLVTTSGHKTVVLDNDLETIQLIRAFGIKSFFGDPTRLELLHAAGLKDARVLVVALDDKDAATRLVALARHERAELHIIARARDRQHVFELYRAGADQIVRELFDSSLRAGRYVLEELGYSDWEASEMAHTFYQMDRAAVKELAQLWDPAVPIDRNAAYVSRAKELNKDLETAIQAQIERRSTGTEG